MRCCGRSACTTGRWFLAAHREWWLYPRPADSEDATRCQHPEPVTGGAVAVAVPRFELDATHCTGRVRRLDRNFVVVGNTATPVSAAPPIDPVPLGSTAMFGRLSPAAIGNAASTASGPVTLIRGDIGSGSALTGFPPGDYTGILYDAAGITVSTMCHDWRMSASMPSSTSSELISLRRSGATRDGAVVGPERVSRAARTA